MKILGLETASGRCSVAITEGNDLIASDLLTTQSMQAEQLMFMLTSVLNKANLTLKDVGYLAVSNGPGSFTGIRIGLATALGLSMAEKLTPVVVSNFSLINFRIREQFRGFDYACAIIDAYRGECYLQAFDKQSTAITEPKLIKLEDVSEEIAMLDGRVVCGGSTCHKLLEILPNDVRVLPRFHSPDARIVCRLANTQILKGNFSSIIEPLYIRLPDAKLPGGKTT